MRTITHEPYQDTKELADLLVTRTLQNGGATVGRHGEDVPEVGYVVGGKTTTLSLSVNTNARALRTEVARWIERQPTLVKWLGGWIDDGRVIFDTCDVLANRIEAEAVGITRKQKAIYNLANHCDINL